MSSIVNLNKHSKGKTNIKTLDIFQKKKSEGWIPNVFDRELGLQERKTIDSHLT